jgi:hypothetical protein
MSAGFAIVQFLSVRLPRRVANQEKGLERNGRLLLRAPFILRTRTFVGYCMMRLIAVLATARIRGGPPRPTPINRKHQAVGELVMPLIAIIVDSSSMIDPGEVTAD